MSVTGASRRGGFGILLALRCRPSPVQHGQGEVKESGGSEAQVMGISSESSSRRL